MSIERRKVLKALGANLVLTEGAQGHEGGHRQAPRRSRPPTPTATSCCSSSRIRRIRTIHFKTTGPEIWEDTGGAIDVLVSGVGTGGTITGISRYIKRKKQGDPLGGGRAGGQPGDHADAEQGAAQARPAQDSGHRRRLHSGHAGPVGGGSRRDGHQRRSRSRWRGVWRAKREFCAGISCGAAVAVAVRLASRPGVRGQDHRGDPAGFRRTLSDHVLFEGLFD